MQLLNFSVGVVQAVQIGSELVRTAHVKNPQEEPWIVTPNGAAGDERAVHPDKLYAFARTAYEYWGRFLGRDPSAWADGFFGENLTLDVLDEQDVRIGDVFEIGSEVSLFVSGARTPCLKLAWRLNQPRTFQKTFALSGHTGVYLGVVRPGVVRRCDPVRRIHHDPSMPSVAEVCAWVASHHPPPLRSLEKLLAFERLSPTLRLILGAKLDYARGAPMLSERHWHGWRDFWVARVVEETSEVRSVHLQPRDNQSLPALRPGQFVTARLRSAGADFVTRCWSVSDYDPHAQHYRLTVKRQSGPGSSWIHAAAVGADVQLRQPRGAFVLDVGGFRPVVLIAGGVGITPLFSMLRAHLSRTSTPIYLLYSVRSPDKAVFADDLAALQAAHPGFTCHFFYSQTDTPERARGRMTADEIITRLADLHVIVADHRVSLPWFESDMYLCGPAEFCRTFRDEFVARGANADQIFTESFTARPSAQTTLDRAQVTFQKYGKTCVWDAHEDLSLLELAEQAGLQIDNDCRAGSCLSCRTPILHGSATSDLGDGTALLCIGRPRTDAVTLDC